MDTSDRILITACRLYLKGGLNQLSMRKIAAELDITATAIYRHYNNKEALLAAMVDEGYRRFAELLYQALGKADAAERMSATGDAYRQFGLEHQAFYQLIFVAPQLHGDSELPERVKERANGTFRFLVDRVREVLPPGADSEQAATAVWAMSHGLVSLHHAGLLGDQQMLIDSWKFSHHHLFNALLSSD